MSIDSSVHGALGMVAVTDKLNASLQLNDADQVVKSLVEGRSSRNAVTQTRNEAMKSCMAETTKTLESLYKLHETENTAKIQAETQLRETELVQKEELNALLGRIQSLEKELVALQNRKVAKIQERDQLAQRVAQLNSTLHQLNAAYTALVNDAMSKMW